MRKWTELNRECNLKEPLLDSARERSILMVGEKRFGRAATTRPGDSRTLVAQHEDFWKFERFKIAYTKIKYPVNTQ